MKINLYYRCDMVIRSKAKFVDSLPNKPPTEDKGKD